MRKFLILGAIGAAVLIVPSASAQTTSPTITVDRIDCAPIDYGADNTFHSTAGMRCSDTADGVSFALHQLGGDTWLTVEPEPPAGS